MNLNLKASQIQCNNSPRIPLLSLLRFGNGEAGEAGHVWMDYCMNFVFCSELVYKTANDSVCINELHASVCEVMFGTDEVTFGGDQVFFDVFTDGTARLHGQVSVVEVGGAPPGTHASSWALDVAFDGTAGPNPAWDYYHLVAMGQELVNLDDATDFANSLGQERVVLLSDPRLPQRTDDPICAFEAACDGGSLSHLRPTLRTHPALVPRQIIPAIPTMPRLRPVVSPEDEGGDGK